MPVVNVKQESRAIATTPRVAACYLFSISKISVVYTCILYKFHNISISISSQLAGIELVHTRAYSTWNFWMTPWRRYKGSSRNSRWNRHRVWTSSIPDHIAFGHEGEDPSSCNYFQKNSKLYDQSTLMSQRDGRMDRRTTYHGITALCRASRGKKYKHKVTKALLHTVSAIAWLLAKPKHHI